MAEEIIDLLGELAHRFKRALVSGDVLTQLELTPFEAKVLAHVGRDPMACQHALVAATGRDKGQVARVLKVLESRGLVARTRDPNDRRLARLELSKEGAAAWRRLRRHRKQVADRALAKLDDQQRAALRSLLLAMRDEL